MRHLSDRHTASVYHSMRALEIGLKAMADRLGAPYDERTWGQLSVISSDVFQHTGEPIQQTRFLNFCLEAATHFRFLKSAWRDHTMHGRREPMRKKRQKRSSKSFNSPD